MQKTEKQQANSSWFSVENVPGSYIFPEEDRPGEPIPICDAIPVIDLGKDAMGTQKFHTIQHIMEAAKEFQVFQVTDNIISETMRVLKEFFDLPEVEKENIPSESGCVYTSGNSFHKDGGVHLWRDCLKHPCYPLEECIPRWPENPTRYGTGIYIDVC